MRRLFIIVMVLAILYGGYWFVGARAVEGGAQSALDDLATQGWDVAFDDLETRGFPSRFDTTITDLRLTSPDGALTYATPFLQAFALSYQPNKVIAAFPPRQTFTQNGQTLTLGSDGLRASAAVKANAGLSFDTATAEAQMLSLATDVAGVRTGPAVVAARANGMPNAYDLYARIDRITLPDDLWQQMFPHGAVPLSIDLIRLDAAATLDRELNRDALAQSATQPRLTGLTLREIALNWGDVRLSATGTIAVDDAGIPTGRIILTAARWDRLVQGLANIGIIDPGVAPTVLNMGEMMQAGADELTVPISFQNGFMTIGAIPVGPAPRLR